MVLAEFLFCSRVRVSARCEVAKMILAAVVFASALATSNPASPVNRPLTPDEVAMILATFVAYGDECDAHFQEDKPLGPEVAKLGQDVQDFMPNGRYQSLMDPHMTKAAGWIKMRGKADACDDFRKTLEHFLPGIF
jgi:hypothetical protein